jgi:hypothetical protein
MKRERMRQREFKKFAKVAAQAARESPVGSVDPQRATRARALTATSRLAPQFILGAGQGEVQSRASVAAAGQRRPWRAQETDQGATGSDGRSGATGTQPTTPTDLCGSGGDRVHADGRLEAVAPGTVGPGAADAPPPPPPPPQGVDPALTNLSPFEVVDVIDKISHETHRTIDFGINHLGIAKGGDAEYGSKEAIFRDLVDLGVQLARQPGSGDTLVPQLLGATRANPHPALPLYDDLDNLFEPKELKETLRHAWKQGIELALTLGSLGGGAAPHHGRSADGKVVDPVAFTWDSAHEGNILDGYKFGYSGTFADERQYLDIRDNYQVHWLYWYGWAVGVLLYNLERELAKEEPGFEIRHVVRRVEVFNEIDVRNTFDMNTDDTNAEPWSYGEESWTKSAKFWAAACYMTAKGFRYAWPSDTGIELWLPGISSYDVDEDDLQDLADEASDEYVGFDPPQSSLQGKKEYRNTWSWKINFFREFVDQFMEFVTDDEPPWLVRPDGVDYHWYHRKLHDSTGDKTAIGPLHISRLAWEVGQIWEILDDAGIPWPEVSVMESGVSAKNAGDDFVPDGLGDVRGMGRRYVFQAQEVVRRLAGAAASGASAVGWHCLQGAHDADDDFYGTGLRADGEGETSGHAVPRWSWFAMKRTIELIGNASVYSFALPEDAADEPVNSSGRHIADFDIPDSVKEVQFQRDLVVIDVMYAYVDGELRPHLYLVLLDPWREWEGGSVAADAGGTPSSGWILAETPVPNDVDWGVEVADGGARLRGGEEFGKWLTSQSPPPRDFGVSLTYEQGPYVIYGDEWYKWSPS